ncbi:isochorismate synthase MenF [Pseudanabaena sp. PCC 6802]|uniref:isochorismate synthase n=1 Tax=Pseudanabaena sp. PCC 6802 TaxID=118173 RepID=UPI0003463153|nr:isochorismate synthase [Pseudanabaena sp. PCC 6802]
MQLEQRIVKPITHPASLQDLIRVAIARAKHLEQPIILSYTQAWQHVDPLAFLAAKHKVGQYRFYWQQPEQGLTLAAGGMVADTDRAATLEQPDLRFDLAKRFAQRYLTHAVVGGEPNLVEPGADRGVLPGAYVLGGFSFHDVDRETWYGFPAVKLFIPQWLMRQTTIDAGGALSDPTLTINHCVYPLDDPEDIEVSMQQSIAYLRQDFQPKMVTGRSRSAIFAQSHSLSQLLDPSQNQLPGELQIAEIVGDLPWADIVQQAVDRIRCGKLDKVVLARALEVTASRNYDPLEILDRLRQSYPECIAFLVDFGMGTAFLGATPEMLLKFQTRDGGLLLSSEAVAGSIERSSSADADVQLGDRLLNSHKDRSEHEIVIESICNCLHKVGANLHPLQPPKLLKLSNVQHLYTPIVAELANTNWLAAFDVLAQLHPTAAVGGDPKATALHLMREWEVCDRGWYAAPIGWVNSNGEGAFAVGIRSGYFSDNKARIYAGAGIVSDSQLDAEFDETAIKFEALLQALDPNQD